MKFIKSKLHWVAVSQGWVNNGGYVLLGFKSEKQADKAIDYIENITDVTTFIVDNYGHSTTKEVQEYFKQTGTIHKVLRAPALNIKFIKGMFNELTV